MVSAPRRHGGNTSFHPHFSIILFFLSAAAFFAPISANSAPSKNADIYKVVPVDEASRDKDLAAFRDRLLQAARQHDSAAVVKALAPNVQYAMGGGSGPKEFSANWDLDKKNSAFWNLFEWALAHGGRFEKTDHGLEFGAPYCRFFSDSETAEQTDDARGLILDQNVPVYKKADLSSAIEGRLSNCIVKLPEASPDTTPVSERIVTFDKQTGYVESKHLRYEWQPFATFRKVKNQWRLVWFGAMSR